MIISEKQIMQLIYVATEFRREMLCSKSRGLLTNEGQSALDDTSAILTQITNQQSDELISRKLEWKWIRLDGRKYYILKGESMKEEAASPGTTFDVDDMDLQQLRDVMKMLMRLMNHEHDRVTQLQDRVLMLEINKGN